MNVINILAGTALTVFEESGIFSVPLEGIDKFVKDVIELFSFGGMIGLGILLFSLILKILPLPLDIYSRASTKKNALKMEKMRPELEKLQKQYANNKELYSQKMMALYKKEGYSALASCLPTIVTLVFFIIVISSFNRFSTYSNLEIYNQMAYSYNNTVVKEIEDNYSDDYELVYVGEGDNKKLKTVLKKDTFDLTDTEVQLIIKKAQDSAALTYKEEIKKYKFLWVENIWIGDLPWKKSFISIDERETLLSYSEGCSSTKLENHFIENESNFKLLTGSELLNEEKDNINGYLILVVLSIGTMLVSQLVMSKSQKAQMELQSVDGMNGQAAQTTKMMTWMMPIMFGIFSFFYSAAFSIYLVVSTVFSMLSTIIINKIMEKKFEKQIIKEEEEKYQKRYGHLLKNKEKKD